jgi:hypothetical protein
MVAHHERKSCAGERQQIQSHGVFSHKLSALGRSTQVFGFSAPRLSASGESPRNPVDCSRERIPARSCYRAQSGRLEVGEFIAHVCGTCRVEIPPLNFAPMMDKARRHRKRGGLRRITAFKVKHEAVMIWQRLRAFVPTFVLALSGIAAISSTADARTIYDGPWSVLIITDSGPCDRAYRYGVQITDGMVVYDGSGPIAINMQGRVTPKGAVRVIVSAGSQWADGSGRMTRNKGGGVWKGQGMTGSCAGTWEAERRPS